MWETNRNVEELGEVREHRAVESVRCGPEEEGVVAKQDGQRLEVSGETILKLICTLSNITQASSKLSMLRLQEISKILVVLQLGWVGMIRFSTILLWH